MVSSGMLRRVDLVRTDVSEERSASFIRVTRIGELGTTLAATSNRRTQRQLLVLVGDSILTLPFSLSILRRVRRVPVAANVVHTSRLLATLMMEALGSS
jgi:hypothetical protein